MSTSDEKKAPPYTERLQKEHCTMYMIMIIVIPDHYDSTNYHELHCYDHKHNIRRLAIMMSPLSM